MTEKRKPESQAEKFRRVARDLGCEDNDEAFERAFKKAVPPKRPKRDKAEKPKREKPGQ